MRKLLLLLTTLLWLGFWWWWYTCKICTTCACAHTETVQVTEVLPESGVILFNLNDTIALLQQGWPVYKDSVASGLKTNQYLEIEGHYLDEEPNVSSFTNMGLARANAIKKLLPDSLQPRINLSSLLIEKRNSMQYPFVASKIDTKTRSEKIEQSGENTLIYFNYNSDQRINDSEIESYLADLASKHKDLNSTFVITGHTDNVGDEATNMTLGLNRANAIKKFLVSKGIVGDRIKTKSMGENEPIDDNSTKEGRQKNRRTEIEIIQKL